MMNGKARPIFWLCVLTAVALLVMGFFTLTGVTSANSGIEGQERAQARTDCARVIADETNALRDAADRADRAAAKAARDRSGAFDDLIVYAVRNPSPPGTVSPEVQALNDELDRQNTAVRAADRMTAKAAEALRKRLEVPNAERVARRCPSV